MNGKLKENISWVQLGIQLLALFGGFILFFSAIREDVAILKSDMQGVKRAIERIERDVYVPRSGG